MFAPAKPLRNLREQRPSNKGDLDSSVTGEAGRVYYMGVDLLLISFLCHSTLLLVLLGYDVVIVIIIVIIDVFNKDFISLIDIFQSFNDS
jgi:hypothetical protein